DRQHGRDRPRVPPPERRGRRAPPPARDRCGPVAGAGDGGRDAIGLDVALDGQGRVAERDARRLHAVKGGHDLLHGLRARRAVHALDAVTAGPGRREYRELARRAHGTTASASTESTSARPVPVSAYITILPSRRERTSPAARRART